MTAVPTRALAWQDVGTERLMALVADLPDDELARPSLLPGWTRTTLLAHVALNAGALRNLVAWARTGVETPMYPGTEQRNADIARLGAAPPAKVRAEFLDGVARLADDLAALPADRWDAPVRTASGRAVPATEIPWMRTREVWVHAVDLDAGTGFGEFPPEILAALLDDAAALMSPRPGAAPVAAYCDGREWRFGPEPTTIVSAGLPDLCAWALGRPGAPGASVDASWPELPTWL